MKIEHRLAELEFTLPPAPEPPPGFAFPFEWARVRGNRVYLSGHSAQHANGSLAGPFGKVPSEVGIEDACVAARLAVLSMLGSLHRAIGDLDRISAWLTVAVAVNADSGFPQTTLVGNGLSDLIVQIFGTDVGAHARTALGMAALPLNQCVIVSAEVEIDG